MSQPAIRVENLSKSYLIGHQGSREPYHSLRDTISRHVSNLTRRTLDTIRGKQMIQGDSVEEFWALKDVSFEVQQGEVLGIIGRNGAGKSTLLKVLSRITEPTSGRVTLNGRIASLLEVGTGFHPELSGRENIYLNGAILGMKRSEIKAKFDEIVEFSGVEKFIDTPVKRYSSGMYVRLAFAVAAHLEPEILVVDEVLAVGDTEFQKKCMGKMQDVAGGGRTVLFVSHNMKTIQTLCQNSILLELGQVKFNGPTIEALQVYSTSTDRNSEIEFAPDISRPSITAVRVDSENLDKGNLIVEIDFISPFPLSPPVGGIIITSMLGTPVYGSNSRFHNDGFGRPVSCGGTLQIATSSLPIHGGIYKLSVWLADWEMNYEVKHDALTFHFKYGSTHANTPNPEHLGFTDHNAVWRVI